MNIYDFKVTEASGQEISLKQYEGKVLLIINSATECGFTPQYANLQSLYEAYAPQGFEILDFPCNQFGNQAPGTAGEIHSFCSTRFGVTFPIFEKICVNGADADPLFTYLKSQKGFSGINEKHELGGVIKEMLSKLDADYENNAEIKWNFTKFLIDRQGNVAARFEPTDFIEDVEKEIKALL